MLIIRQYQMRALEFSTFERWVVSHMREHFPSQCANLGDTELLQLARAGIAKARRHGFVKKSDLCRFADLTLVMGADFDTDPGMPWAAVILGSAVSGEVKIELLETAATDHLRAPKEESAESDTQEEADRDDEDEVWAPQPPDEMNDDEDDENDAEDEGIEEDEEEELTAEASTRV
jgi:hypothetical protein